MATSNENPFVFPGMGQANPDLAGNPLMASMEMMRKAWAGLAGPGGLTQSLPMAPPMNLEELDKRIAELKSVEGWLSMNLSMLSSTIQGMEVQRSTISTLRSFVDAMSQAPGDFSTGQSPLEAVLGIRRPTQAAKRPEQTNNASASGSTAGAHTKPDDRADAGAHASAQGAQNTQGAQSAQGAHAQSAGGSGRAHGAVPPAGSPAGGFPFAGADAAQASQAWWDMLQQQFKQLATATAATMPAGATAPGASGAHASGGSNAAGSTASASSTPTGQKKTAASGTTRGTPKKAASKSTRAPAKAAGASRTGAAKKSSGSKSAK